jgi:Uncharacterized protein conserved in bacteria
MDFVKSKADAQALALLFSRQVFGRPYLAPPGVPKARVAALRAAFDATMKDPAFIAEIKRQKLELNPLGGIEMQKHIEKVYRTPKAIVARAIESTKSKTRLAKIEVTYVKHKGKVTKIKRKGRRVYILYNGKEVKTKISGRRTKVTINGKKAKRKAIKVGMTCQFTYPGPGEESKRVDCQN